MIGLKRGTVTVVPHHKGWDAAFKREKKLILRHVGDIVVDIEHIGSTAVRNLSAKPVIDMSLGVRTLHDAQKLIEPLSNLGYNFYKKFQQQVLFAKGPDKKRTHYLHVMRYRGAKWRNDILFRDYLSNHPAQAREYAILKKKLAKLYPINRERYSAGKHTFIQETLRLTRKQPHT